ncbi:DUF2076 domain-containing protein [Erwinia amylovora]|uniref:DUF2076 domain-containing protein n=1 Tax=Erwinia amylovora TaxID=552 RepID=UPI0002CC3182|nr:DUF2076 domain-containing protein [Erwinia amylovora]CCP02290.1 hypothetical protein BN439_1210 [Erwinia amylovora Ea644]UDJ87597.1 DUF2076 domain-containing protein [Erwinia amylovora]UDJ99054.1 DUF2076 domain-containing protein [Erwinia amylovora]UDK88888.1 DUF2076 domain-containing protein [Erwinia amylovora]UDK92285.1 DUF2076 domain-containing protein [Erwinia amylovora]
MQNQEQQLIEGLFSRLKQAESQSAPRDSAAETLIQQQLRQQPGAPYYMAQTILIQEAALKQLNGRIGELEARLTQMQQQQPQQSSGGFLSGLFGGGSRSQPQQQPPAASSAWGAPSAQPSLQQPPAAAATSAGRGFLGGALQTAAGVAGGVVLADMLTSMFHRSQPEEIVNIINEPAMPETDFNNNLDTFNGADNASFLNQDSGQQDYANSSDNDSFANDGFDSSDFDDDSFV